MYSRILVPLDGSATSQRGLAEAIHFARGHATELVLMHVIEDFPTMSEFASSVPPDEQRTLRRHAAQELLKPYVHLAEAAHLLVKTRIEFAGELLHELIIDTAVKTKCDLIILGTHGRHGVIRAVLGSVAEAVVRHSPLPVMLVPPPPASGITAGT